MKHFYIISFWFFGTVNFAFSADLNSQVLTKINSNYDACIAEERRVSTNENGVFDEVFFLEGKAHCDNIKRLQLRKAQSEARISSMTDNLIKDAKRELSLK